MWYRDAKWRSRLLAEQSLMRERFPQFMLTQSPAGLLVWRGVLRPVEGVRFEISVILPARYPYEAPELRAERPPLKPGAPHVYSSGALCVHRLNWDPMRGTAVSVIPLAAAWLVGYMNWLRTGENF